MTGVQGIVTEGAAKHPAPRPPKLNLATVACVSPGYSVQPRRIRPMPDLGYVAGYPSIVCRLYGVENRRFFIDIFPVDLIFDHHKPAFFVVVSTDPEEHRHERSSLSWK